MKNIIKKIKENRFLFVVFGINFAMAFLAFIYFIVRGGGLFTQSYDFNAQELSFNMLANQAIKNGDVFWNWNIDIGSDFVETYSFYNIGSPFFWITLLFPASAFPYIVGWVYMLKYAVAGLLSYIFIKRFVKNRHAALIGSMLYAFSGFQSCNLLFYHFHDVVALFPLLLIGLEKLQTEKKKGIFAFAVFINCLVNYFFFIGEVFFIIIYYVVRFLVPEWKEVKKQVKITALKVTNCIIEGVIGVMMAGVLFVPSILSVLNNPRVGEHINGNEALVYNTENVLQIIKGLFFPSEGMQSQASITEMNWYSIAAYLPLVGMFLVLAYVMNKKKDWISNLLKVSLVIACIPLLNNLFVMFTREYYRRWYYMPILIMALASALVIEKREEFKIKKPFIITMIFMAGYVAYMALYPWNYSNTEESGVRNMKLFLAIAVVALGGVILTYLLHKKAGHHYMRILS